jgi:hypothetical protein
VREGGVMAKGSNRHSTGKREWQEQPQFSGKQTLNPRGFAAGKVHHRNSQFMTRANLTHGGRHQ